jgi:hypothetical protein
MSDADLCNFFSSKLQEKGASCGNWDCDCRTILSNPYLSWFWQCPSKYDRNMILFEWYKYSSYVTKVGQPSLRFCNYHLLHVNNGTKPVPEIVHNHLVCTKGLQKILGPGRKSFLQLSKEAMCSHILPPHKARGKHNYNAIENDEKSVGLWKGISRSCKTLERSKGLEL